LNSLQHIFGYIDSVIDLHPGHKCVLLGDFNFECTSANRGFCEFKSFAKDLNLTVLDDRDNNNQGYTYCHATLNQKSLIDHVFMHADLTDCVTKYEIVSDGANLSDHLPVQFSLSYCMNRNPRNKPRIDRSVHEYRWDKGDLLNYYFCTGDLLSKINHNFPCKPNCSCNVADHCIDIEVYYAEIVHCLGTASKTFVPQIPKSALKHYWSVALDELKHDSCNAHNIWLDAGKPHSGPINEMKKNAHYKYKLAVRDAMSAFEHRFTDDLLDNYLHKDSNKFWETWKKHSSNGPPVIPNIDGATEDSDIVNKFADYFSSVADHSNLVIVDQKDIVPSFDCSD